MFVLSSWHRGVALVLIAVVPLLALALPLYCFATGMW
jgi:hypothetical protein